MNTCFCFWSVISLCYSK